MRLKSSGVTGALLAGGLVAGPLFTVGYLLQGFTRTGYSAWRHPVSSLALGRHGWMQVLNFLVSGGLLLGFGVGARRADRGSHWPPRLIGAVGFGLIGAGVFACDPIAGYPPGTPQARAKPSVRGALHQFFSAFVFLGLPALFLVDARGGTARWASYSAATCACFIGSFGLSSAGFGGVPQFANVGGLFQRICLSSGLLWLTLRAKRMLRDPRP